MLAIDNELVEKILQNEIEKQEAIQVFNRLSEAEKKQLISKLKFKLSGNESGGEKNISIQKQLKTIDQRDLSESHRAFIEKLSENYENFVPKSKKNIIDNQFHFVDQRRSFHLIKDLKNMHFQITYAKAEGAYVYDVDGNKYIDISGDMGVNLFGHKPSFVIDALKEALDRGIPLAGYSELIYKTTKLFSEITGQDRVLFTQSGTEAVMVAIRIARAVTQKKKIALFEGAFHGLSDAVLAMKDDFGNSHATGPGMLQEFAEQIIVLDYGDKRSLDIIEERCDEIAGVLVEPVQSRHIYNKPIEFLKELRKLTLEKNIPLIFDEMITGLRVGRKGAQGEFNILPDLTTYGKIPGGGLPTGVIAGSAKYMDMIDGGTWNFGDDSMPKAKKTGMGGTHTQNPLKIASAYAVLSEIERRSSVGQDGEKGTCFYSELNMKTKSLAEELNTFFSENNLPITIDYFGSLFRFRYVDSYWGVTEALMFILLRMNGIETNIQGNCFLTTAHTDKDVRKVIDGVKASLNVLMQEGFFYEEEITEQEEALDEVSANTTLKKNREQVPTKNNSIENLRKLLASDFNKFQNKGGVR